MLRLECVPVHRFESNSSFVAGFLKLFNPLRCRRRKIRELSVTAMLGANARTGQQAGVPVNEVVFSRLQVLPQEMLAICLRVVLVCLLDLLYFAGDALQLVVGSGIVKLLHVLACPCPCGKKAQTFLSKVLRQRYLLSLEELKCNFSHRRSEGLPDKV